MGIKEQLLELEQKISEGLEKAYRKMLEFKKYKNSPVVISQNGKIVEVAAEDLMDSKE